ncbi:c-type cytochrome [Neolewinella aurantiaca]|uniref:C-type cytochrome n=1 Tax=Neolewinella aurantiaca TaxID=2602767 RepID=A0A5C7FXI7_9BACT|nr:di-heme oxidoredictase family protein [Neolewinella aurantiaca]TXF90229.1 c-type cytochrome [Neolewinella aurantiaca]
MKSSQFTVLPGWPFLAFSLLIFLQSCEKDDLSLRSVNGEELSGGTTTIFAADDDAFSFQAPGLSETDGLNFFTGNSLFNQNWVTAPASTTARDGLGPLFNARSCSGCHFKDGRGRPPAYPGEVSHGLLLRLSTGNALAGDPIPDPYYGGQLQDQSVLNVDTEAAFSIDYETITGSYADGSPYELQRPNYRIGELTQGELTATNISPRIANQMVGLGLLEAIDETTLLAMADPNDADGDGISGKVNYVYDVVADDLRPGRFGWKANQPSVLQQVAAAFAGDLGITSDLFPDENCPPSEDCSELANGGSPEIPMDNLQKVTLYSSTLAVPGRRNWEAQDVLRGKEIFRRLNCSSCHREEIVTGDHPDFPVLSGQTIRPYTDMLLHDMGEGLADNSPEFLATGQEWRTPPLWGIGLFNIVNGHTNYLHDGRARDLEEAILWHGGEAADSREGFKELSASERDDLLAFLNSL